MGCGTSSPKPKAAAVQPYSSAPQPKVNNLDQFNHTAVETSSKREDPNGKGETTRKGEKVQEPSQTPEGTQKLPTKEEKTPPVEIKEENDLAKKEATPNDMEGAKDVKESDETKDQLAAEGETSQSATGEEERMGAKQSTDGTGDPLTETTVHQFVDLETEINKMLGDDVESQLKSAQEKLDNMKGDLESSGENVARLKAKTEKEYCDVAALKGANMHQFVVENYQQQLSKEEEEYFSALNEQKMEERNHEVLEERVKKAEKHIELLKEKRNRLRALLEQQENLLCDVFDGDYGSEREQKLELKVNVLMDKQRFVKTAHLRWSSAQFYLDQSLRQIHVAIQRWVDLRRFDPSRRELIYRLASEARNNLSAAIQNTSGARQYLLPQVHAPYCTEEDLQRIAAAVHRLFYDMMYPQTHRAAYDLFVDFYRRSCLFHQWIDHILKDNINKDLGKTSRKLAKQRAKLMAERKRILMLRAEGKEDDDAPDDDVSDDEEEEAESEEEVKGVMAEDLKPAEADAVSQHETENEVTDAEQKNGKEGSPGPTEIPSFKRVPLSELAPPPSTEQVYGNVDELMKQHEEELLEFNRAKEKVKERTEEDLKEKLRQRRSRRRKIEQQAIQEQLLKQN